MARVSLEFTNAIDRALAEQVTGVNIITRGGLERTVRCFYCGDSSNLEHGHLGITRNFPLMFSCKRCGYSGAVSEQFLTNLGVAVTDEIRNELASNRTAVGQWAASRGSANVKQVQTFLQKQSLKQAFKIPDIKRTQDSIRKYNYLCGRFDQKFSLEELKAVKFIPSLRDFLDLNYVTAVKEPVEVLECLERNYVMFPAFEGSKLICRNITSDELLGRYYELKVKDNGYRFYNITTDLDINNPSVSIIAAEGVFDVIGLWLKFPNLRSEQNSIFAAMLGKGYKPISEFLSQVGFLRQNISIYADNDVDTNFYRLKYDAYKRMKELGCRLCVYHNKLSHDWGIPSALIDADGCKLL